MRRAKGALRLYSGAAASPIANGAKYRGSTTNSVIGLPISYIQQRNYAKPMRGGAAPEKPKKEYNTGEEYLDDLLRMHGIPIPTWDDIPEAIWKFEVEMQKPKPFTPLAGRAYKKAVNRETIKDTNLDRTWGVIKGKWKLGE